MYHAMRLTFFTFNWQLEIRHLLLNCDEKKFKSIEKGQGQRYDHASHSVT